MGCVSVSIQRRADPGGVDRVLRSLPDWFGIEEAIQNYVSQAAESDSHIAVLDEETVGVALTRRHFPESAELTLLAVDAAHRGRGIGRLLVAQVEAFLRATGCRFLEVHTVGPSYDDAGYEATRAFYRAVGFAPIQELNNLDWDGPTLIMIKSL